MSEIYDKLIQPLMSLGLTEKESQVYLDLLGRSQPTGTSKIVHATGLHGQFVYDALAGLEEKGLATHIVVGKRKRFAATNPARLELLAERKRKLASEVAQELELMHRVNHFQDFEFYQGEDAFVAHEFAELSEASNGEEWLIIGGSGDKFANIMGTSIDEYDSLRVKKNISMRYIGSDLQKSNFADIHKFRRLFEIRYLSDFSSSIVNTLVRPGSLSLSTYAEPVLTYSVRNRQVAESYRNFFESLWLKAGS